MTALQKAGALLSRAKSHWKTPPEGRYMNYREICAYSFGGIGVYAIITIVGGMILSTSNTLIGNTIGIDPQRMYVLYLLAMAASIPLTALRASIIDNSRSREGKYRPFLIKMGFPSALLAVGFVWMPYERMSMFWKCATVLLFNIGFQFFFNFFRDSYENLIYVLSPDSRERTDVLGFKSVIYSIGPTIINPLMPLCASFLTNGSLNDIRLYRIVYPPIAVTGMLLSLMVYANTREKTLQARSHAVRIRLLDALREVARNKYFWIISCAGWVGFLEGAQLTLLYWLYQYGGACSSNMYAVITFIYGDAALWGMMAAPFAIRRYGKKRVLILTNLLNIFLILLLYPASGNIWLVLIFMYLNALVGSFSIVLGPSIQADIRDYQHYISGERIDGMFAAVGLIGSLIGMVTSGVLPRIYTAGGIALEQAQRILTVPEVADRLLPSGLTVAQTIAERAAAQGITAMEALNAYDALYDPRILSNLTGILIFTAAAGALLNLIPYLFYDLTDARQQGIVQVLKLRAFFEDYSNGLLSEKDLLETAELIRTARENAGKAPSHEAEQRKKKLRHADRAERKAAVRAVRAEREQNRQIEVADFVVRELDKFRDGALDQELARARALAEGGPEALRQFDPELLRQARALPHSNPEEKRRRREAVHRARQLQRSARILRKHFKDGIREFDPSVYKELYGREEQAEKELIALYADLTAAGKQGERRRAAALRKDIAALKQKHRLLNRQIRQTADAHALFISAARPYLEAKILLRQHQAYSELPRILQRADALKESVER